MYSEPPPPLPPPANPFGIASPPALIMNMPAPPAPSLSMSLRVSVMLLCLPILVPNSLSSVHRRRGRRRRDNQKQGAFDTSDAQVVRVGCAPSEVTMRLCRAPTPAPSPERLILHCAICRGGVTWGT